MYKLEHAIYQHSCSQTAHAKQICKRGNDHAKRLRTNAFSHHYSYHLGILQTATHSAGRAFAAFSFGVPLESIDAAAFSRPLEHELDHKMVTLGITKLAYSSR